MKKLLTIAVAVIAASAMQAATLAWGGDTINSANTTGLTGNGTETSEDYEGYATAGTVYTLILMGATEPTGTPTTYDQETGKTDLGGTVVDTHTLAAEEADSGAFQGAYGAPADNINGKYFMVTVYDPNVGSADYKIFQASGASDTGNAADGITPLAGLGGSMGSIAVPEPCSVALLALGLAALGLKRKVA